MDSQNVFGEASSSEPVPGGSGINDKYKKYEIEQLAFNRDTDIIGKGGYGKVYRGIDLTNGETVAIKELDINHPIEHFEREIEMLSKLKDPNLVKILGRCLDHKNRLIVLEYMPKISLKSCLHGTDDEDVAVANEEDFLNWERRMKIALGSARGIAFLHAFKQPMIHRDIKPHNILLDNDFEPKIADFGQSRLMPDDKSYVRSNTYGTSGYVARECIGHPHNRFNTKSDVFAFGVVLLELITGKKPIISRDLYLHEWVQNLWDSETRDLMDIVDANLKGVYDRFEMKRMIRCAIASTRAHPDDRPKMSEIVKVLAKDMDWWQLSYFQELRNNRV